MAYIVDKVYKDSMAYLVRWGRGKDGSRSFGPFPIDAPQRVKNMFYNAADAFKAKMNLKKAARKSDVPLPDPDGYLLHTWADKWIEFRQKLHKSSEGKKIAANTLRIGEDAMRLMKALISNRPMGDVSDDSIMDYDVGMTELRKAIDGKRELPDGYKYHSRQINLRNVRTMFRWARKKIKGLDGITIEIPEFEIIDNDYESDGRFLDKTLLDKLIPRLTPLVARAFVFALHSGCRLREIINLDWSMVNFNENGVCFLDLSRFRRYNEKKKKLENVETKTRNSRSVPIGEKAVEMMGMKKPSGKVFEGLSASWFDHCLLNAWRDTEPALGRVRVHDCRHTLASILAETLSPRDLMDRFGWQSYETAKKYIHRFQNPNPTSINPKVMSDAHYLRTAKLEAI